ncbi:hypothetical protein M9Y10_044173 [Tritrichomonas musculus]|uniref:Uncharacterized protein n=1 Tax=Tritrichomonas musculus TaxID=1915356 RepID=A0ABR2K1Q0_9EUKA
MVFFFILSIFLPALNRKNCDKEDTGFTCDDLNKGINYVQNVLLKRKRSKNVSIIVKIKSDSDCLFSRLATLSYALATDSFPLFPKNDKQFKSYPDIAVFGSNIKYDESKYTNIQICNTTINLPNSTNYFIINSTATSILFSPALNILYEKIGPAALHIIIHLALNLSYSLDNYTNYAIFQGTKKPDPPSCGNVAGALISNRCDAQTIIEASKASNFVMPLANLQGWLINLIRGSAPYLYDNVGKGCWKAASYLSGGINPIYPGKGRSELDVSRSNIECPNTTITKKYLKILL